MRHCCLCRQCTDFVKILHRFCNSMQYPDVFYSEKSFPKINCSILIVFFNTYTLYIRSKSIINTNLFHRTYIKISQSRLSLGDASMGNGRLWSEEVIISSYYFKEFRATTVFIKERGR